MDPADGIFTEILQKCEETKASDIHLTGNVVPYLRVRGEMVPTSSQALSPSQVEQFAASRMTEHQRAIFAERFSMDFSFCSPSGVRYRANVFRQRGSVALAIRRLDSAFRSLDELMLPPQLAELGNFLHGLILVTGPTGSGKSTTLATLIHQINCSRNCHIITVEDPLEFIHENRKSLVRQRELYTDVHSFAEAIRAALREDPDVLLVGEMRDLETVRAAVIAAETGHLVFSSLHTNDVVSSITRVLNVFPPEEQESIRDQLSRTLRAVVSQRMVRRHDTVGRVPAIEIMRVNSAVANLIRTGDMEQIYSVMQTGAADGMLLLEQSLATLLAHSMISRDEAQRLARDNRILDSRLRRIQEMRTAL